MKAYKFDKRAYEMYVHLNGRDEEAYANAIELLANCVDGAFYYLFRLTPEGNIKGRCIEKMVVRREKLFLFLDNELTEDVSLMCVSVDNFSQCCKTAEKVTEILRCCMIEVEDNEDQNNED